MTLEDDKKEAEKKHIYPLERLQAFDGKFVEKPFEWHVLDGILRLGAEMSECVGIMRLSESTIIRKIRETHNMTFSEYRDICKAQKKLKLRAKLWEMAESGNVAAAIWLSKNELGMSDKISQEVTGNIKTIKFAYSIPGNKYAKEPTIEAQSKVIKDGENEKS